LLLVLSIKCEHLLRNVEPKIWIKVFKRIEMISLNFTSQRLMRDFRLLTL